MDEFYNIENYFDQCPDGCIIMDSNWDFIERLRTLPSSPSILDTGQSLDAHSYREYGTEGYWWVLAIYNDIIDPDQIDVPQVRVPARSGLDTVMNMFYRGK